MLKVKTFFGYINDSERRERFENEINEFLENSKLEIVDIKYSSSTSARERGVHHTQSAMVIYKEK